MPRNERIRVPCPPPVTRPSHNVHPRTRCAAPGLVEITRYGDRDAHGQARLPTRCPCHERRRALKPMPPIPSGRPLGLRPPTRQLHRFGGDPALAALTWRLSVPWRAASTAAVGGGIGPCEWVLNIQVPSAYARRDVGDHVSEVAAAVGLEGSGIGMLTAIPVAQVCTGTDGGVHVAVTVGVRYPVWAAAPDDPGFVIEPGTINIVAFVPVAHSDAALANLLCTATEAKVQALQEVGVPGTGTASDAVAALCPPANSDAPAEPFGGPRSPYGACVARATHSAIVAGLEGTVA